MLPIYNAKRLIHILEKGGRTKPWLVEVEVEGEVERFAVKLFTPQQVEKQLSVTAEVVGNILAKNFELPTLKAAFIEFDEVFVANLQGNLGAFLESQIDSRYKFATVYKEGCTPMEKGYPSDIIEECFELEMLYAFDNLIRNRDRSERTPNLLIDEELKIWLIDHEMALYIPNNTIADFHQNIWQDINEFNGKHFLYSYLKGKNLNFDTFQEYLSRCNFERILMPYIQQLIQLNFPINSHYLLTYFFHIQQNSTKFIDLIKAKLQ